ncbi:WD40/YVTN repeat-like-containing domain [Plasmopara halstedii]|uniref:WD40/YVTN repeat-like-containing domain n=1 Tax=Plasmopara halstedii TaxID=4781 RepID=A0A0P1B2B7_PLAHL|nr:WD40/YVTN repeat-like-containing domain [Plasmopara halstedii]CEG48402.1 WD40/YVTN repeat-like-containing domain [Plasmopara halstedii]|eukprot:XP_024584771.1 WD40/YVTN repeat-like-containing domain [Plasmopara halstedii]
MTLQSNGTLDVINSQTMQGGKPAYAALSFKEDFISVANYAGSISLFPLELDGSVGALELKSYMSGAKEYGVKYCVKRRWPFSVTDILLFRNYDYEACAYYEY